MQPFFQMKVLLLPIGISFYTLQAIGYMADVYWEKIPAERHLGKLALFLGFFPQIMEGPICSYSSTADTLWKCSPLTGANLSKGSIRIFWGLFKKMIIADRLYVIVCAVFDHYENYSGVVVVAAAVAYTVQLYMEFSGCMDIVIGSGRLFGVELPENFPSAFCIRECGRILEKMAYYTGGMVENLCILSGICFQSCEEVEPIWKKTFGKIYHKTGNFGIRFVSSLAVQWIVAWTEVELYFLWNVLFCGFDGWSSSRADSEKSN